MHSSDDDIGHLMIRKCAKINIIYKIYSVLNAFYFKNKIKGNENSIQSSLYFYSYFNDYYFVKLLFR